MAGVLSSVVLEDADVPAPQDPIVVRHQGAPCAGLSTVVDAGSDHVTIAPADYGPLFHESKGFLRIHVLEEGDEIQLAWQHGNEYYELRGVVAEAGPSPLDNVVVVPEALPTRLNRRRGVRVVCDVPVQLTFRDGRVENCRAVDICSDGIGLQLHNQLDSIRIGESASLHFKLTNRRIDVDCVVAHAGPVRDDPKIHWVGVRFTSQETESREAIADFVAGGRVRPLIDPGSWGTGS